MLEFNSSKPLTLGVELELQLVNRRDYNLTRAASDLLRRLSRVNHGFDIKPEITESMIEIATGVHTHIDPLLEELEKIRELLLSHAEKMNIGICGGGAHPFQHWDDQRIYNAERYQLVSELYGYLAKQFTVYGQHIHIGCPNGDAAVELGNFLGSYLPDFIALAASSPFYQGVDTAFQSSRLTSVNAFPLSGRMPGFSNWAEFTAYFEKMKSLGIVESMKDFYWDLRPKPEYGTIEIRVCDSPLDIRTAAILAAYAQALAAECFAGPTQGPHPNAEKVHSYNRFQACRFGLKGRVIDPVTGSVASLGERIDHTLNRIAPWFEKLDCPWALRALQEKISAPQEDADWLREIFAESASLPEMVRRSAMRWALTRN
jgi:glutamate---cysteine ligase / carboxylate-amine ligase